MSSTKKRDLAEELVEFLLTEDQKKSPQQEGARTHADKTEVLAQSPDKTKKANATAGVEFELNLGDDPSLEVNFTPSWKNDPANQVPATAAQTPVVPQAEAKRPHLKAVSADASPRAETLAGQAEALRIVQSRIRQLEIERDQLRDQSEQLLTATESLERKLAETRSAFENSQRSAREKIEILEEEKAVLRGRLQSREHEVGDLRKENEGLKNQFKNDLRKVRVRERELENRMELMKAEQSAVLRAKDESMLGLKRQIDQMEYELENFRTKTSELNSVVNENHDRNQRMVKALRLALSLLEGDEDEESPPIMVPLKKVNE